jgi:nitrogen fixation protein FixH
MNDPLHWRITGTAMLAIMILFLIGVVLACIGLVSLYIAHIYAEVVNRPLYVIRNQLDAEITEVAQKTAIEEKA